MADLNALSLYHKEHCPFCHKVRAVMTELKLDIPLVDMTLTPKNGSGCKPKGAKAWCLVYVLTKVAKSSGCTSRTTLLNICVTTSRN